MKKVYILRGISGSGKSTLAQQTAARRAAEGEGPAAICSADNYFVDADGVYKFRGRLLSEAHNWCLQSFIEALYLRRPTVIVDNTNTTFREFEVYMKLARIADYEIVILEMTGLIVNPEERLKYIESCATRNVHGVPMEVCRAQSERYQLGVPNV